MLEVPALVNHHYWKKHLSKVEKNLDYGSVGKNSARDYCDLVVCVLQGEEIEDNVLKIFGTQLEED